MKNFEQKVKELIEKLKKNQNDKTNYPKAAKEYLTFLVTALKNKSISREQFDKLTDIILMTDFSDHNNEVLEQIWGLCSDLDIPANDKWWNGRNRNATRKELIEFIRKL